MAICSEFEMVCDILTKITYTTKKRKSGVLCVAIPACLENLIIKSAHNQISQLGCHRAGLSMFINYKKYVYFPSMFCKLTRFANACVTCNRFKTRNIAQTTKSNANSVPEHVLDQVSSDYGGPFPKSVEGYQYVCTFFFI